MSRRRLIYAFAIAAAAAAAIGLALADGAEDPAPEGAADVSCDRSAEAGDDPAAFVAALGPGETGCFRDGTHRADTIAVSSPDVTLTSYPGESATLAGRLWIQRGSDGTTVADLMLDGRNEEALPSPTVNADQVTFVGNDVSNDHTAICFVLGDDRYGEAQETLIERNRIHDCGRLPATNHDHGVYIAHARDSVIRENLIYGNADRGVQFYPDADRSLVTGNVIAQNGQGVSFGGNETKASGENVVEGNVITGSTARYNVESNWPGPVGSDNVVSGNCLWQGGEDYVGAPPGSGVEPDLSGVESFDNIITQPSYDDGFPYAPRFEDEGTCDEIVRRAQ